MEEKVTYLPGHNHTRGGMFNLFNAPLFPYPSSWITSFLKIRKFLQSALRHVFDTEAAWGRQRRCTVRDDHHVPVVIVVSLGVVLDALRVVRGGILSRVGLVGRKNCLGGWGRDRLWHLRLNLRWRRSWLRRAGMIGTAGGVSELCQPLRPNLSESIEYFS